ncbi:MAG TPA: zinc ribbon domain-containing protein [Abditibacteriaceae bacterium]|jgi:putative FmdB family regulatory protein
MPLFEYRCGECAKVFTFLTGVVQNEAAPRCPHCNSEKLNKLMSRFARGQSDDERMDVIAEKLDSGTLDDEANLRRFAREMSAEIEAETGETLGDDFEELAGSKNTSVLRDDTIY